jgi:hypothetical protein
MKSYKSYKNVLQRAVLVALGLAVIAPICGMFDPNGMRSFRWIDPDLNVSPNVSPRKTALIPWKDGQRRKQEQEACRLFDQFAVLGRRLTGNEVFEACKKVSLLALLFALEVLRVDASKNDVTELINTVDRTVSDRGTREAVEREGLVMLQLLVWKNPKGLDEKPSEIFWYSPMVDLLTSFLQRKEKKQRFMAGRLFAILKRKVLVDLTFECE